MRHALIDTIDHRLVNVVEYEGEQAGVPPGLESHLRAIAHPDVQMDWTWDGTGLVPPAPPVVDLAAVKVTAKAAVNTRAEVERQKHLTPGAGQALVYEAKRTEVARWRAAGEPAEPLAASYPWASDRAARLETTVAAVLAEWGAQADAWAAIGIAIERAREAANAAIDAAADADAAWAAVEVTWPAP